MLHARSLCTTWKATALTPLALAALAFAGCSDHFTDTEMHLGSERKIRPIAVLCDPPEAAPGEIVTVTLMCWAPDPSALRVDWQVALDYDLGGYEADEVERHVVPLGREHPLPPPVDTGSGFLTQTFRYQVPDSVLLQSSAIPVPIRDEATIAFAQALASGPADPRSKDDIDAYLRALTAEAVAAMDAESRGAALALADRFACRIRFRAKMRTDIVVDVTRNLTVRHSGRLGSPNVNANPGVARFDVVGIPRPDADDWDDPAFRDEVVRYPFLPEAGGAPVARVPVDPGWTYYLVMAAELQEYRSPFSGERLFTEADEYRWYYFRLDVPSDSHALFRNDTGDETEMYALDDNVRLIPPAAPGESRYRVIGCVRDARPEWTMYQTSPGATAAIGEIVFTRE